MDSRLQSHLGSQHDTWYSLYNIWYRQFSYKYWQYTSNGWPIRIRGVSWVKDYVCILQTIPLLGESIKSILPTCAIMAKLLDAVTVNMQDQNVTIRLMWKASSWCRPCSGSLRLIKACLHGYFTWVVKTSHGFDGFWWSEMIQSYTDVYDWKWWWLLTLPTLSKCLGQPRALKVYELKTGIL